VPTFKVTVLGRGILLPVEDEHVLGFLRLVRVVADDQVSAEGKALAVVRSQWEASPNARLNQGEAPQLRVDSIDTLPWWQRLLPQSRGYVFFLREHE
jgi:hypothetical protein